MLLIRDSLFKERKRRSRNNSSNSSKNNTNNRNIWSTIINNSHNSSNHIWSTNSRCNNSRWSINNSNNTSKKEPLTTWMLMTLSTAPMFMESWIRAVENATSCSDLQLSWNYILPPLTTARPSSALSATSCSCRSTTSWPTLSASMTTWAKASLVNFATR